MRVSSPRISHRNGRVDRAITILELLIAIGGLVVVSGLALGVYESTMRASKRMITRSGASDYAIIVMDDITALLREAIPSSDLQNAAAAEAEFKSDRLTVATYRGSLAEGLFSSTVRSRAVVSSDERTSSGIVIERIDKPIASAPGAQPSSGRTRRLGTGTEGLQPRLTFRYAQEIKPGEPVKYLDELPAGQWPRLVEVKIAIALPHSPDAAAKPVILQTAVIPGRLPNRGSTAAMAQQGPAAPQSFQFSTSGSAK